MTPRRPGAAQPYGWAIRSSTGPCKHTATIKLFPRFPANKAAVLNNPLKIPIPHERPLPWGSRWAQAVSRGSASPRRCPRGLVTSSLFTKAGRRSSLGVGLEGSDRPRKHADDCERGLGRGVTAEDLQRLMFLRRGTRNTVMQTGTLGSLCTATSTREWMPSRLARQPLYERVGA